MPINVLLDDSPLHNSNSIRGVGTYTRFLVKQLSKNQRVNLSLSKEKEADFKPEITHYPFFDLFYSTLPLIKKTKTVVTIHDVIPLLFPQYYPVGKKGKLALVRQRIALHGVDAVVTDSNNSKTDIAKYLRFPLEKIHVIYLAADPELKVKESTEIVKISRKYKLPKKYLLYVGDINYNKNIPQLIKMLKFLPKELNLLCVGKNFYPHNIPEWQWIESQIALSNVENRVKFLTNLDSKNVDDLATIYSGAIAYIQPSIYEGFGLPILEAMSCHAPVICAKNSSLSEIVLNKAFSVEKADAENFALAVKEILAWNKDQRIKFIKQASLHARKFTWEKTAKAVVNLYQEILKK